MFGAESLVNGDPRGPTHIFVMMGEGAGDPSDFFGSEILAKSDFFRSMKDARIFLGCEKKQRDFLVVAKKDKGNFLGMLKKVVIFWGRQILKLRSFWV